MDSYAGKPVMGKLFIDLEHDCDPFVACPVCTPKLVTSGWTATHDNVAQLLAGLR